MPFTDEISPREAAKLFLSREVSWLRFNQRVLEQSADRTLPLLERIFFLGIFSSNLDEFFMKRVGGLHRQMMASPPPVGLDGKTPKQQLTLIRASVEPLLSLAHKLFEKSLRPALAKSGIKLLPWQKLSLEEREFAHNYFHTQVFPVLTPLAVDSGQAFPFISNLSTSLGVALADPEGGEPLFARVKISGHLSEWIYLDTGSSEGEYHFLNLRDLVERHIADIFPHMEVLATMPFRITRNADVRSDSGDEADDLLELIEEELRIRRFARVVRLEHGPKPNRWILQFLMRELQLSSDEVYEINGQFDYQSLYSSLKLELPELRFAPWVPVTPPAIREGESLFEILKSKDLLVHHPYESFGATVERFLKEAVHDPAVRSIKMTVYRVGDQTPLIPLLIEAAEAGKQVVVLVELKARFDEERNMHWGQSLEEAGVHVRYGIPGLKTHAKVLLIVRQEAGGLRSYAHFGTGNYHNKTANLYTDLGYFTADPKYTTELLHLFNFVTGRSLKTDYNALFVAPFKMEDRFLALIDAEKERAARGEPARIVAKMNGLEDRHIIRKLYEASSAGVQIELIVRGICSLRPGVKNLSENIRVFSVLGRFLEHSRIFYFQNGASEPVDGLFIIGSADWMGRNLHRRLEVAIAIDDLDAKQRLWQILTLTLNDYKQAWEMQQDGSYIRRKWLGAKAALPHQGTQNTLIAQTLAQYSTP